MKKKKSQKTDKKWRSTWFIAGILAIGILFTHKAIEGEELNYDDERYITHNELIRDLSTEKVGEIFSTYFDGHYHPLTMLSLAIDGALFSNPIKGHHVVNWLLHLANAVLVYIFLLVLFKEKWLAFGVALLFVVHPMTVESYAWMTERKNVLYSFFFLGSALAYLRYLSVRTWQVLGLCFLLFVLSILSKAQAMMLLPVLFLIDWIHQRELKKTVLYLEKIPFLLVVLAFVFLTSSAQVDRWGELNTSGYLQVEKFFLASTAFAQYVFKGFLPFNLSAYYPYPNDVGMELGWQHYAAPAFLLIFLAAAVYAFKRSKIIFFGLAFFFINIVMMLKFLDVPFGSYLMANRYNYLPLIGLMLVLVLGLFHLAKKTGNSINTQFILLLCVAVTYGILSYNRTKVWNNNKDLWTDIIEHYPHYQHAYNMRALGYIQTRNNHAAIDDFNTILSMDSSFVDAYVNLAVLHFQLGEQRKALGYITEAKKRFPEEGGVFRMSADLYSRTDQLATALEDIERAIRLAPGEESHRLIKARILIKQGKTEEAKILLLPLRNNQQAQELLAALQTGKNSGKPALEPQSSDELLERATALAKAGNMKAALELYGKAIEKDPKNHIAYLNRGSTYARMGDLQIALADFKKALEINPEEPRVYFLLGVVYKDLSDKNRACSNLKKASQLGWQVSNDLLAFCN